MDQGEGDDQQRPADAELVDLVADFGGVAVQRRFDRVAQRWDPQHHRRQQGDAGERDPDLQPRRAGLRVLARRTLLHPGSISRPPGRL